MKGTNKKRQSPLIFIGLMLLFITCAPNGDQQAGASSGSQISTPESSSLNDGVLVPIQMQLDPNLLKTSKALDNNQKPELMISQTREEEPAYDWNTVMTETFEGAFPTGLWTVFDKDGYSNGQVYWGKDNSWPHYGSWSAWCARGGANGVDPLYYYYPPYMDSWMVYGPFSLVGTNAAELSFYYWQCNEDGSDYFAWMASVDGVNFYGNADYGCPWDWVYQTFDLTNVPTLGNLTGQPQVWIAFVFKSNGSNEDWGTYVDDILLRKYTIPPQCTVGSGPCCDSYGYYRPSSYLCSPSVSAEYACMAEKPKGKCGDDVVVRYYDQYCSGTSYLCNGSLVPGNWYLYQECSKKQICNFSKHKCAKKSTCPPK